MLRRRGDAHHIKEEYKVNRRVKKNGGGENICTNQSRFKKITKDDARTNWRGAIIGGVISGAYRNQQKGGKSRVGGTWAGGNTIDRGSKVKYRWNNRT